MKNQPFGQECPEPVQCLRPETASQIIGPRAGTDTTSARLQEASISGRSRTCNKAPKFARVQDPPSCAGPTSAAFGDTAKIGGYVVGGHAPETTIEPLWPKAVQ